MALRRRIGISTATTEAARRQLMQPVPCWEKVWVIPEKAAPGSTLKVLKWVKTDKVQQFSDDEGDVNEPLAPLPDEPEVAEGDDDVEQEDATQSVPPEAMSRDASEPILPKEELPSKVPSPKPHPLSISFGPPLASEEEGDDGLGGALQGLVEDGLAGQVVDVAGPLGATDLVDLDLSQLGPDGTAFEAADDLTQRLQAADGILGADIVLNATLPDDDPFMMEPS
ncbi:hypothetical protein F5148DRAFT_1215514 [Russula earlei]|uniref:Uncharacterized protein n=1 Tax=Russula earlei TaxID=71964 RepID=A0ACC0U3D4_9AGAM|nr:hypothetical protein F5148DRAFT_1215514 [Russula earlei]